MPEAEHLILESCGSTKDFAEIQSSVIVSCKLRYHCEQWILARRHLYRWQTRHKTLLFFSIQIYQPNFSLPKYLPTAPVYHLLPHRLLPSCIRYVFFARNFLICRCTKNNFESKFFLFQADMSVSNCFLQNNMKKNLHSVQQSTGS